MSKPLPFTKDAILMMSHFGGERKSGITNEIAYACEINSVELAKFDADGQNNTTFKRYATRDKHGLPLTKQDPVNGCKKFNFETDALEIANVLEIATKKLIIDLPARAVEKALAMFGDEESFYNMFSMYERNLIIGITIASDKSFISIKSFYESVNALNLEHPVTFALINNVGLQKATNCLAQVEQLYTKDPYISEMKTNPKFNVIEVVTNTKYDEKGYVHKALADDKLSVVMDVPRALQVPVVHILLASIKKDANELFKKLIVRE